MKRFFVNLLVFFYVSFIIGHLALVRAEYVLPYPSFMPGNTMYRVSRITDTLKGYWHWGTIAQIRYHLGLSDKYLVEAKTLFEYKQYLLATDALVRSDEALAGIVSLMEQGTREGKDMSGQKTILIEAMKTHISTLAYMKQWLPDEFQWTPEKEEATDLAIGTLIDASLQTRHTLLGELEGNKQQYTYINVTVAPW